ncbi:MAG: acyl-CoA dehydrogenase domain-containing protein, partial [Alcaligenes sp.]
MVSRLEARATRHYYDSAFQCQAVKVLPNEYYVTNEDLMISTVLGSCVAACIHDPVTGVGGMNHFMLPEGDMQSPASATMRYGAFAMEVLINELLKAGAARDRLTAGCHLPATDAEPVGAIEQALAATLDAEPIEAK